MLQHGRGGTHGLLESSQANLLLLLALHGVIKENTGLKDVQLPLSEEAVVRKEGASRVLERVGEAETEDEAAHNGETTHEGKQPEPTSLVADTAHVEDTIGQELGRSLTELVTEVEEHDTLGGFLAGVPGREGPETTGDEARLGDTKEEPSRDEGAIAVLESLEGTDGAEEEELQGQPLAGADTVEDHVGGDLEEHDAQRQHLLADVELVLRDTDILHEVVGDGIGNVSSIELCMGEVRRCCSGDVEG